MKALLTIVGGIVALAALGYWATYNNLVNLREEAVSASSLVQNACQRQADLVPNLVRAVKSYAAHEKDVLTQVTEARARVQQIAGKSGEAFAADPKAQQELAAAQTALRGAMLNVVAVAEKYPDLKASGLYQDFMAQLEGSQNRISHERANQVKKTKAYNAARKGLLTSIFVAGKFEELAYYEAPVGEKSSVEVNL